MPTLRPIKPADFNLINFITTSTPLRESLIPIHFFHELSQSPYLINMHASRMPRDEPKLIDEVIENKTV